MEQLMAAFLTLAIWFSGLGVTWWLWATLVDAADPARGVIHAVFFLAGLLLVWFVLFGNVPGFMHFGPHHAHGLIGF